MATGTIKLSGELETQIKDALRPLRPEKVILFGSYARGDAGPDSDVDLLIVMPVSGSTRQKAVEIGVTLHDVRVPKDVIVTTPEEFEWRNDTVGTIEWPAWHEGRVLYAKEAVKLARRVRREILKALEDKPLF